MGKFDGILLMSDFDGTLYCNNNVSYENRNAIRYFQSEGGLFALCSGRPPYWLSQWTHFFVPNTYCPMMNGTLICSPDGQSVAHETPMDNEFVKRVEEIREACPRLNSIQFYTYDRHIEIKNGEDFDTSLIKLPVFKVLFHTPAEYSDEYLKIIEELAAPNYMTRRSWINGIEIQMVGSGKGDAVYRLKEMLGARAETVVAAGDYENDIDMIKAADIGYAVGNALPNVKEIADRVTVDCTQHAIAKIIEEL